MTLLSWITARRLPHGLVRAAAAAVVSAAAVCTPAHSDEPIKLAVFPVELEDVSAGGGIIAPDERDRAYLAEASEEMRRRLSESGRYRLVDTGPAAQNEHVKARTLHACSDCVGPIARSLGAGQAVVGTIKRITRTEYTLLIQFFDASSGEPVANYFTGLRMGANYSWPRGVIWLMKNRILVKSGG